MAIKIINFTRQYEDEVLSFNKRLSCGDIPFRFPSTPHQKHSSGSPKKYPAEYFYLAVDDASIVRGGYIYQEHQYVINGAKHILGVLKLPLSEGIINKAYNMVGFSLVKHALDVNPYAYALGMGGEQGPFAKLLRALGWRIAVIPFFFSIINPRHFLENISILRTTPSRCKILDFSASCGLGWAAHSLYEAVISSRQLRLKHVKCVSIDQFKQWADVIWDSVSSLHSFTSVRDTETLNNIYRHNEVGFKHVQIISFEKVIGWATLLDITKQNSPYFGDMRVMCIINCHCLAGEETAIVYALKKYSRSLRYDLLVGNFSHLNYQTALHACGFLKGPSNLAFATSPELSKLCTESGIELNMMHITRGDGDGT